MASLYDAGERRDYSQHLGSKVEDNLYASYFHIQWRPLVDVVARFSKVRMCWRSWRSIHRLGEKRRRTWQEAAVRWMQDSDGKADHHKDIAKLKWLDQFLRNLYLDEINRDLVDHIGSE